MKTRARYGIAALISICSSVGAAETALLRAKGIHVNGSFLTTAESRDSEKVRAVRYVLPEGEKYIEKEDTIWALPLDAAIWYQSLRWGDWDENPTWHAFYEAPFSTGHVADLQPGAKMSLPITARMSDGTYVLMTEANVVDFTDSAVEYAGEGRFVPAYYAEKGGAFKTTARTTPWRVLVKAADLNALGTTDVLRRLCPSPSAEVAARCRKFVRPGKCVWQWLPDGDPKYNEQKKWYDQTRALGFPYYLVDDGWKVWRDGDKDQWDCLKRWIDYGKSIGVESFIWVDSKEMLTAEARRGYLDKVVAVGAVGIKIDFIPDPSREIMAWYEDTLADTLDCGLMTDFHGCVKPSGREKTWPHEIAREAIRGHEWQITRFNRTLPPEHDCILPFHRLVQGHVDYTPVVFEKKEIGPYSWPRQLAQGIVFSAPFLCFGDYPQNYLNNPMVEIIRAMEPVYDETRYLPGSEIGVCVVVAKRKGDTWFLAIENGAKERTLKLSLSFLKAEMKMLAFHDDPHRNDAAVREERLVNPGDEIEVKMRPAGGFVAMFLRSTGK